MQDVTRVLSAVQRGDPVAARELLPLVYDELRKLAAHRLVSERPGQTLQATALVHEAYLRLVGSDGEQSDRFQGRGHFFAAAAEAIRRILVDNARRKASVKAGGEHRRVELADVEPEVAMGPGSPVDVLALDDALLKLETVDARKAQLIKLRFFAGLTNEEAAATLGISSSTADSDWAYARAWLRLEMDGRTSSDTART